MKFYEDHKRSIAKSLTFRMIVLVFDFFIIITLTHQYKLALGVIFFSNISSTLLYFFHERIWNGIHWGKRPQDAKNLSSSRKRK